MKVHTEQRLFWFLKNGTELNLSNQAELDLYVQQIISRGSFSDVKKLVRLVPLTDLVCSFGRIKNFLPKEVRSFWEEGFGYFNRFAKKNPRSV